MFFDTVKDLAEIASKTNTAVFVMPDNVDVEIKNALLLRPEGKATITIEQVREILAQITTRQLDDVYVVVRPANALGDAAANALLKSLEEPGDKVHFVLITSEVSQILPTILSRAAVYFMRSKTDMTMEIVANEKDKALARKLLVAKGKDLVDVAEEINKKKDGVRAYALEILRIAIEMLYKSYLLNGKEALLKKIPKFLRAYEAISKNGHVRLQIVSNLC